MIRPVPCFNCGSRGSCRHREVEDVALPPVGMRSDTDMRPFNIGRGKGGKNSPWGAKGNPAGPARDRMLAAMKASKR